MNDFVSFIFTVVITSIMTFFWTASDFDTTIGRANLAQELCIKANSKAVSFDRTEVTCENNAVIPLKKD